MEANLIFQLELDYLTIQFPELASRAIIKHYDPDSKKFMWSFYVKDIDDVVRILGKPITFEAQEANINKLVSLCPPLKSKVELEQYKGVGENTFVEEPELFLVGEWQKDPKTGTPKQSWQRIPKEVVLMNWEIIKQYPLDKWVKIRTQAEHVCRHLGFDQVFRESGTFDWSKFTGLHRKGHLPYVYYPIKILANLGVIEYSRIGKLKRVRETLEFQHQIAKKTPDKCIHQNPN